MPKVLSLINGCSAILMALGLFNCSKSSAWNYNWALGIHLESDVHKQGAQ